MRDDNNGKEKLVVGNETSFPILHIGSFAITNCLQPLYLNNILHVPQITKNLISASKLTRDNDVVAEFFSKYLFILLNFSLNISSLRTRI